MAPFRDAVMLGQFAGPIEPAIATIGSGTLGGIAQYLLLRREGIVATRWLVLLVVGFVLAQVPPLAVFPLLETARLVPGLLLLPLAGAMIGGVAALVSGRALSSALSQQPA